MATVSSNRTSKKRLSETASPEPPRSHWGRRFLLATVALVLIVWLLPIGIAFTALRDRPLGLAFTGINGTIASGSASLGWFSPVVYHDVELRDAAGNVVATVATISSDRSLLGLATHANDLGQLRIEQPVVSLELRPDGSNVEEVLLPWLNRPRAATRPAVAIEVVDGAVAIHDVLLGGRWRIEAVQTSVAFAPADASPVELTVSGTVASQDVPAKFSLAFRRGQAVEGSGDAGSPVNRIAVQADPLPLEMFRPLVARVLPDARISGRLSANFQYQMSTDAKLPRRSLQGQAEISGLDLAAAPLGKDRLHLDVVRVPCRIAWQGDDVQLDELGLVCDAGQIELSGRSTIPALSSARGPADWLRESFTLNGQVNLAELAKRLPETLHLRSGTQITSGDVKLSLASSSTGGTHQWKGQIETSKLVATNGGRPLTWEQPVVATLAAHDGPAGPVVETLDCQSDFFHVQAAGTLDKFTAQATCDLDKLAAELGQFVDLGSLKPAGEGQANLKWQRSADGGFTGDATGDLRNLRLVVPGGHVWSESLLTASAHTAGKMQGTAIEQIDQATLDVSSGQPTATSPTGPPPAPDHLTARLVEPANDLTSATAPAHWIIETRLQGDLSRWQPRLAVLLPLDGWELRGNCDLTARAAPSAAGIEIGPVHGSIAQLHAWGNGLFIDEPQVQLEGTASWDSAKRTLSLRQTTLLSSTISLAAKEMSLQFADKGPATLAGTLDYQADLARVDRCFRDPRAQMGAKHGGRVIGEIKLSESDGATTAQLDGTIDNFAIYGDPPTGATGARPAGVVAKAYATLYQEPRISVQAAAKYDRAADSLGFDSLDVTSAAFHVKGSGRITKLSAQQDCDLTAQVDYDWQTLGPLLRPYLGTRVQLVGRESRQFTLRGPLAIVPGPSQSNGKPQLWDGKTPLVADPLAWLRPLVAEGAVGWTSANFSGLQVGTTVVEARLADGTLGLKKPLDLPISEGHLILDPKVRLGSGPAELTLGKGPLVQQMRLTPEMCAAWLKFVAPLMSEATRADGRFSVDLDGGRVPLDNPAAADISGKLTILSFDVTPGPIAHPFSLIGRQVRAIFLRQTPPTAVTNDHPLLKFSQQTVAFRVVQGRVYHDNIEMLLGDLTIRTRGSVGLVDETLNLEAEVPVRSDWLRSQPAPGQPQQVVRFPITGTLGHPHIDPRVLEQLATDVLKNSAQDVRDGIGKLLHPGQ